MKGKSLIKKLLLKYVPLALVVSSVVTSTVMFHNQKIANEKYDASLVDQSDYIEMIEKTNSLYELVDGLMARKAHNSDKPIYVTISSEFSDQEQTMIKESLDYIFGLVGEINPNYRYEIVDKLPKKYSNIVFTRETLEEGVGGKALNHRENKNNDANGGLYFDSKIKIDPKIFRSGFSKNTIIHEILHVFGFDDVYIEGDFDGSGQTSKFNYENTFMKTSNDRRVAMIYPEDYKILLMAYAPDFKSEAEKHQYLEYANKKYAEYVEKFYDYHSNLVAQDSKGAVQLNKNLEITMFCNVGNYSYFNPIGREDSKQVYKAYYIAPKTSPDFIKVKIENNVYIFTMYNKEGSVVSETTGSAVHLGDQVYLRNVNIPNFMNNGENYVDLRLFYHEKNGAMVYDIATIGSYRAVADYYSLEYLRENTDVWEPEYYKQMLEKYKPFISDVEIENLVEQCEINYQNLLNEQ